MFLLLLGCDGNSGHDGVHKTFNAYKDAILHNNGSEAVKQVDRQTIDYYSKVAHWTRHADSLELEALNTFDKFMVLTLRLKASPEEIRGFDGTGLFVYGVDHDLVSKEQAREIELGDITIDDDRAQAVMLLRGEATPMRWDFVKEDGRWKLQMLSIIDQAEPALAAQISQSGMTENEFLLGALRVAYGDTVADGLWRPVSME
jgi:hypothetical protein